MEIALLDEPPAEDPEESKRPELVRNDVVVDERPPDEVKRVSEFDNRVEKETRAPRGKVQETSSRGQRSQPSQPSRPASAATPLLKTRPSEPSQDSSSRAKSAESAEETAIRDAGQLAEATRNQQQDSAEPRGGVTGLAPRVVAPGAVAGTLGPSPARPNMRPGTYDRLEDVDEGDQNLLSTKRYRYASFFNRVRDAIAQHWHPDSVHARYDPQGNVYGKKPRITVLKVRLSEGGAVINLDIVTPSGARHLDEEALRSVRAAAPFANPPQELIDPETRTIEFNFGFELTFDGGFRIFRWKGQ